ACAAEAEAPIMLLAEPGRTATRLAAILGRMQHAAAQRASSPPRRNRDVLLSSRSLTTMAKPGRNDPCPCGSGNKYKKCCLPKEEAAEREQLAKAEAR